MVIEKEIIILTQDMISGDGNVETLVSNSNDAWQPSKDDKVYPKWAYINLGKNFKLTDIRLYDTDGKGKLRVYAGKPKDWSFQVEYETSALNEWKIFPLLAEAQFVAIEMLEADAKISQVELIGHVAPPPMKDQVELVIGENGTEQRFKVSSNFQIKFDDHTIPNIAPFANFSVDGNPEKPLEITCNADKSYDEDGSIVSYLWEFGDGNTGSGMGITHTYAEPGTYTVQLTVKDNDGALNTFTESINVPVINSTKTVGQIMSACTLPDDPLDITLEAVTRPNPYILSKWFAYDVQTVDLGKLTDPYNVEYAYDPSDGGGSWQNNYFRDCANAGAHCIPRFKESFMYLSYNSKPDLDNKPRYLSENGNDPKSWRHISNYFFQFAARYGRTEVADSKLQLRNGQSRVSGLGWIHEMQLENEADKWWLGKDSEFTPEEWAAYHSACYDGHMNTMGDRYGIKNADPKMRVISGPLAHLSYDYLNKAVAWWEANRTDPNYPVIPLDSFSFHRYANTSGPQQRNLSGKGMAPEPFGFFKYVKDFVNWVKERESETGQQFGKEITEFGYDTNSGSPQGINQFGPYSTEDIQAMWMVRSYLSHIAAGADRVAMYMLRDAGGGGGIFVTSGLTTGKGEWRKKASHKALAVMLDSIGDFHFDSIVEMNNNIWVLKFRNGTQHAYSIHTPADQQKTTSYELAVEGLKADIVEWDGKTRSMDVSGGKINITATERPQFVVVRRVI